MSESPDPYLRMHAVRVFVRDQDRSLHFYLDKLGFELAFDARLYSGERWVAVAPPDGTAVLSLVAPRPKSAEYKLIGRATQVVFVTEDVPAKFREWRKRGVRFAHAPRLRRIQYQRPLALGAVGRESKTEPRPAWGAVFARFQDVDGNSFSARQLRRGVARRRRAAPRRRLEAGGRAPRPPRARDRTAGAGAAVPAEPAGLPHARVRRSLHAGPRGGRRLLRLPEPRPGSARARGRRHRGQGDRRGAADGQPAGEPAQPVRRPRSTSFRGSCAR